MQPILDCMEIDLEKDVSVHHVPRVNTQSCDAPRHDSGRVHIWSARVRSSNPNVPSTCECKRLT